MRKRFYCQYDSDLPRPRSRPGERLHQTYVGCYDDNGVVQLIPDKVINVYDEIQSHRDSTDLRILLKRYLAGDTECINKVQGVYGDFAFMPRDYASLLNRVSDGRKLFDSMTANVRSEFGNSYEQFLVAMQHPDFWSRLSKLAGKDVTPVSSDSVEGGVSE